MPEKSPFFERTSALCTSLRFKDWSGFYAVQSYDTCHEAEYYALRHAVGVLDVSPLFKYEVTGPDAGDFLSFVMTRNIARLKVGQVAYSCLCDEHGKMVDDGTVTRIDEEHFRVTSADPSFVWLERLSVGFDVVLEDSTHRIAALAVQGPYSRALLADVMDKDLSDLRFFRHMKGTIAGAEIDITRTGYTGDLGYEIWLNRNDALRVWDRLFDVGTRYGLLPVGLDALDMTRVEAGFVLNGVDYYNARHCIIEARKSTPYELGLGGTVQFKNRGAFLGKAALAAEKTNGSAFSFVGLVADWDQLEALYDEHSLPPSIPAEAWRCAVPVYLADGRTQVGYATSGTWSPILKKNIAMAHVESQYAKSGHILKMEATVEYRRRTVDATITQRPFFDPPRKQS